MVKWKESKIKSIDEIPMVSEVPVIIKDKATGFKAVVDETTKDTICIIPLNYQFIPNRQVLEQLENLKKYDIVDIQLLRNGRTLFVELTDKQKVELLPQDYVERRVRIINSYDKNRSLILQAYGIRLVCENGTVVPKLIGKQRIHAFGTNAFKGELEQKIEVIMNSWNEARELMQKAQNTTVSVKDVIPEFNNLLPKKYMKMVIESLDEKETVYNIWNQLTYVVSHHIQPKVRTSCLISAQKKVNKILELVVK